MNRDWLFSLFRAERWVRRAPRRSPRSLRVRRVVCESLEDRRLLATAAEISAQLAPDSSQSSTGLLVQYRSGASSVSSLAAYLSGQNVGETWDIAPGIRKVKLNAGVDLASALAAFEGDTNVVFAEPDYPVKLTAVEPTDPLFLNEQWNLKNIGQTSGLQGADIHVTDAWDATLGDQHVVVAVIDSGVDYNHPDLYGNIWINQGEIPQSRAQNLLDIDNDGLISFRDLNDPRNQGNLRIEDQNDDGRIDAADLLAPMVIVAGQDTGSGGWADGVDNDENGYGDDLDGFDFANDDNDPMDDYYHGTHVAGTIGATINDVGVVGVAPNVRIMPLKFLDENGGGATSNAIAALNYAVANGAAISNHSWGGGEYSQAFKLAIENAATQNHIVVAAAGNKQEDTDVIPFYPASYPDANVVSVAATDAFDEFAGFSSYGAESVDLAAPGDGIYNTLPTFVTPAMEQDSMLPGYGLSSGTSMAAPQVAGVLALVRSYFPGLTIAEAIGKVLSTVDPLPSLAGKMVTGGRLNAAGALGVIPVDHTPPKITDSDPQGATEGNVNYVRVSFSEPIQEATFTADDIVSFTGPHGALQVLSVSAVPGSSHEFDVFFAQQSDAGNYTLVIGPRIADRAGNELDQDSDGQTGETDDDKYTTTFTLGTNLFIAQSTDVPKMIGNSNFNAITSLLTVTQDVGIADLNVALNLGFPRDGNLAVWLVSPRGTLVMLSNRRGGDHANFDDTVFDDQAQVAIADGIAPFSGSFRPDAALSAVRSQNAKGTWQLFMQNVSSVPNGGMLNSWSLQIVPGEIASGGGGTTNRPPTPVGDSLEGIYGMPITVLASALMANDTDPDGDPLQLSAVSNAINGTVALNNGVITFTPSFVAVTSGSFRYVMTDGRTTALATVSLVFKPVFPWHNSVNPYDVTNDGKVFPLDAIEVINQINHYGNTPPVNAAAANVSLYFDVLPDNRVFPNDALEVVNYINAQRRRNGATSISAQSVSNGAGRQTPFVPLSAAFPLAPETDKPENRDNLTGQAALIDFRLAAADDARRRAEKAFRRGDEGPISLDSAAVDFCLTDDFHRQRSTEVGE